MNLSELDHNESILIQFKDDPLKIHIVPLKSLNKVKNQKKTIDDIDWIADVPNIFKPLAAEIK